MTSAKRLVYVLVNSPVGGRRYVTLNGDNAASTLNGVENVPVTAIVR